MTSTTSSSDNILLPIGYIRKPHGLKGEVKVHLYQDKYSQILESIDLVILSSTIYKVESVRWQHNCALLKLEGVNDPVLANTFKTVEVSININPNDKRLLPEGLFLPEQWINYQAFDINQSLLGKVNEVIYTKANDVIIILTDNKEILLPVTEEYILSENHENKFITVKNPEYV